MGLYSASGLDGFDSGVFLIVGLAITCMVLAVAVVLLAVLLVWKTKPAKTGGKKAREIVIKDGVRYSTDENIEVGRALNVTHNEGDIMLEKGVSYTASKEGRLLPGQYTVLSATQGEHKFNIRLGGFVREYSHGDSIVIPEGGEITSVSHAVLLR